MDLTDLIDLTDLKALNDLKQTTILILKKNPSPSLQGGRGRLIMKKLFTFLLVLTASIGVINAQSGTCGDNLTWELNTETGVLTISGTGAMADYTYNTMPWYKYCSSIQSVIITDGVTSIGKNAFYDCSSLASITIPNSVTSIGEWAFAWCSSLTSVTIPNSVTEVGGGIFCGCSNLEFIVLSENITILYSLYDSSARYGFFSGCSSLKSVTIPNSVTSIGELAFQNCSSLTSITIPNSVTSIGYYAFGGCSSLTSITIPNSVTSIGERAFADCSSLNLINVDINNPNYCSIDGVLFNKDKTTLIQYPIGNNRSEYTIPNSVTSIGEWAFAWCSSLTSVTIPNSVTSIGEYAFYKCSSLTSVINYATQPQAIETSVFQYVDISACQLYVPSTSVGLYQTAEVWKDFGNIQPIRAEDITDVSETIITPSENEVEITWPTVSGAASYELVIKDKNGNIVCTLIFNANGQLTSIAFNAPSRNGVPAQTQSAGFSFTITGLDSGTGYDLTLTAKDNSGNAIQTETISFITTGGNVSTDIDQLQGHKVQSTKVVKDGQVLILRNGKTYTMQGQEVK